jgi:hypothetical protein
MKQTLEQLLAQQQFARALRLQVKTIREFHRLAGQIGGKVCPVLPAGEQTESLQRNFFSTLYLSVIIELVNTSGYLPLYAMVNQAMRACVTAADNILDDEYKPVFNFEIEPAGGRVRSILTIMLADRIVQEFAAREYADFDVVHDACQSTLQALAPTLLEEGTEEARPVEILPPGQITTRIHTRRTANLFLAPLALPTSIEEIDPALLAYGRASLKHFGLSFQILDDIRDMPEDIIGGRHNLCVSLLQELRGAQQTAQVLQQIRNQKDGDWQSWRRFEDVARRAATLAAEEMATAYENLRGAGSQIADVPLRDMLLLVCTLLGIEPLETYLPQTR